ncbi:ADP-ribosylglycohydrolase [Streptomyces sp. Ag109_G2-6]|nr:ADP-ribosylglycohydrolase family protein [Streptomyces sp. Ag109_G2-6]RPF40065.1 ADP-ribosylglycohydrolase [Streptomyces sp. Ag109_G2-6]
MTGRPARRPAPPAGATRAQPDAPRWAAARRTPAGTGVRTEGPAAAPGAELVRLTWAQPEDLVGHELRQAAEDGRDAGPLLRAWLAAGGHPAPARAGASPTPAGPQLRALATRLLDELAALPVPSAADEPTSWPAIRATWPPATGDRNASAPAAAPHRSAGTESRHPTAGTHPQPAAAAMPGPAPAPGPHPRPEAMPTGSETPAEPGRGHAPDRGPSPRTRPQPAPAGQTAAPAEPTPPTSAADTTGPGRPALPHTTRPDTDPERPARPEAVPVGAETPAGPGGHAPERGPGPCARTGAGPGGQAAATACFRTRPRGAAAAEPGEGAGAVDPLLCARLEAAWLGRAVGCVLGKPVEKLPLDGIRALARAAGNWPLDDWFTARGVPAELLAAYPWNRRSAATSLAENIDGTPEDDDLNHPLLGLLLLQRHGRRFTTADLGRLWLDELPAGRAFTAERIAYRNLLLGLEPPLTATHHNPFREWIGALIRADVHGWTNPGDPAAAAEQAWRDAVLSHTSTGVHAALFAAATLAEAASGRADVHGALRAGLAVVPPRSRLAEAVRFGIRTARAEAGFERVVDLLHARYGGYHWVHALPNTALIAAALTHADGDFTRSVCGAVSGGWDTDSNGATAGSVAGLLAGSADRIPERWTAPLGNRLSTTVAGFDGVGFDTLARLTAQEAARP